MVTLIIGGSGSGKSEFAESYMLTQPGDNRIYLATMKVYGDEGKAKVERHRHLRSGKGFVTVECEKNLLTVLDSLKGNVLLECMSNLVANEMFDGDEEIQNEEINDYTNESQAEKLACKIVNEIFRIADITDNIVIVSNNIFEDGIEYDETTKEYMKCLAMVNSGIARLADEVYEVTAGNVIMLKGKIK